MGSKRKGRRGKDARIALGLAAAAAGCVLGPRRVCAADTWDNENGNANWSLGLNWVDNVKPTSADAVTFPVGFPEGDANIIFSSPENALSLTINDSYSFGNAGASLTLAGTGSVTVAEGRTATMAVTINGSGGLTKLGLGTLEMSTGQNWSGGVAINAGMLSVDQNNRLGNAANNITFSGGGELVASASFSTSRNLTLNSGGGQLAPLSGVTLTLTGNISGTGALTVNGTGTVILSGSASHGGGTTISTPSTLQIGSGGTSGSISGNIVNDATVTFSRSNDVTYGGVISGTGGLVQSGAGTLTLTSTSTYLGLTTISSGAVRLAAFGALTGDVVNNATLTFDRVSLSYPGDISGSGNVVVNNNSSPSGSLVLTGSNTYTGTTNIAFGSLIFGSTSALSSASAFVLASGTTLNMNNSSYNLGALSGAAGASVAVTGSQMLSVGASNASTTYSGGISGSGGLIKTGSGVLTLAGPSTYTQATNVSAGTLRLAGADSLPVMTNMTVGGGATLELASGSHAIGSLAGTGHIQLGSGTTLDTGGNGLFTTYAGTIGGSGSLVKSGGNIFKFAGATSHTGTTTITDGSLSLGASERISDASDVTVLPGASLSLSGFVETIGSLAGGGTVSFGTLITGGNNTSTTFSGGFISGVALTKVGSGTFTLNGSNTYNGAITLSGGTLQIGAGGTTGAIGGSVSNSAALQFNRSNSLTYGGVVSGSGSVIQAGTGTLVLSGASTYTGATTISAGTLALANTFAPLTAASLSISNGAKAVLTPGNNKSAKFSSLSFNTTGQLNINDNKLIIQFGTNASPLVATRGAIVKGRGGTDFANATWQGTGGIASDAAAPGGIGDGTNQGDGISFAVGYVENSFLPSLGLPSYTTFGGQTVDSGSMLIRFTRGADCNLDGRVNTDDVTIVGALYNSAGTGEWFLGDFDFDGICDSDDVTVLGALYDATAPALSSAQLVAQYGSDFAAAFERGRALAGNVPEPTGAALVAGVIAGTLVRRRRANPR